MNKIKLLFTLFWVMLISWNLQAQIVHQSDMEEPIKILNHTGFTEYHTEPLMHWLAWVSDREDLQMADGDDGRSWGWDSINPISGNRSLKADIVAIDTATTSYGHVSAQNIFPLIDYTKDYVLEFNTRLEGEWSIRVLLENVFRGGDGNHKQLLYEKIAVAPDGDGKLRFLMKAEDFPTIAERNFDLNATSIVVQIGGTRSGKFVMDDVVLKVSGYKNDMEEPVKILNHTGYSEFYSELGHWLAWVSNREDLQMSDGDDGRSWGWDSINPISGNRSLKADIIAIDTATTSYGHVSVQTVFPLIDYTKDYVLEFNTRLDGEWPIQVIMFNTFRGGDGNHNQQLFKTNAVAPDGDGKLRFVMRAKDFPTPAERNFDLNATQINILIGGSRAGKFVMDDFVLYEFEEGQWEIGNVVSGGANITDAADLSATFNVTYDADFMYLNFDVKDDTIVKWPGTGNSYDYDNIEIFIDPANSKARRYNDGAIPAQQLRVNVDTAGTEPIISRGEKYINSATQAITADGYTMQIVLSLDSLQITPEVGNEIGFDVTIGDNDGSGRESIIAWHNATGIDNSWQNPAFFGTIRFANAGEFEEVDVIPVIGEFDGIFYRADRRGINRWTQGEDAVVDNDDFSGRHYVLWDETNLYIKVEVFDDILVPFAGTGNTYDFDNIEIFLDMENDKAGSYAAHHYQIRYNYGWDELSGSNVDQALKDAIDHAQMEMTNDNGDVTGWILETAIPWSALTGMQTQAAGEQFGFDISIADNDGDGRKAIKVWNNPTGADNNWRHPFLFGVLELAPGAITSSISDNEAPTTPGNLTASDITDTSLKLTWEASTDNWSVFRYNVYLADTVFASTSNTEITLTGLTANTEYVFEVKAVDVSGNASEAASIIQTTLDPTNIETVNAIIRVYPNPITTEVHIESNAALKSVKVISITGQVILNKKVDNISRISFNTSAWANGVYFINLIDSEGKLSTHKMVK